MSVNKRDWTARQVYDELIRVSLAGGFPSVNRVWTQCMYRGPDGRGCGVGIFIPPEIDVSDAEGGGVTDLRLRCPEAYAALPASLTEKDWQKVQTAHDSALLGLSSDGGLSASGDRKWRHEEFVSRLERVPAFAGFTPAAAA